MPSDFAATAITALLLLVIAIGVVWIGFILSKRPVATPPTNLIDQIEKATRHYTDVSAVVEIVRQIDQMDEDAVASLASYPKQVQAAALMHAVNCLGRDLQWAQQELSDAHQKAGRFKYSLEIVSDRQKCQNHVDTLRGKLDKILLVSRQYGTLHSV